MPKVIAIYRGVPIEEWNSHPNYGLRKCYRAIGYDTFFELSIPKIVMIVNKKLGEPSDKPYLERVNYIYRPKDGNELLEMLKERKLCEVVDTMLFEAVKMLDLNNCGFSFSCKKSKWNKGWAGFERV